MQAKTIARETVVAALEELAGAWQAFNEAAPGEFWEAANARLTASLAICQAQLRAFKQAAGYPLHDPAFCLPWLRPRRQQPGHAPYGLARAS
jgi:hypothetical protein